MNYSEKLPACSNNYAGHSGSYPIKLIYFWFRFQIFSLNCVCFRHNSKDVLATIIDSGLQENMEKTIRKEICWETENKEPDFKAKSFQ